MPGSVVRSALLTVFAINPLVAQSPAPPDGPPRQMRVFSVLQTMQVANAPALAPVINALLSDTNAHMRMAPTHKATKADSLRANAIATQARAALTKYSDVALAEQDGYMRFLPWLEKQDIYHYNNIQNVMATLNTFDATKPVSLLYRKNAAGKFILVGAMYSALPGAPMDELDARVPVSIAHWHEHVNFCGPRPDSARALAAKPDSATLAKWLHITSQEGCSAVGGIFLPRLFGWMAHAYLFGHQDIKTVWGGEEHDHMKMHGSMH